MRKALIYRPRTIAATILFSCSLFAQEQSDRAVQADLKRALETGRMEQAHQALELLRARPHVELEILLEAGAALAERELFDPASALFARGVNDYPKSFEARYNLALADFALGRFSEAQSALDGAGTLSRDQQLSREYLRGKLYDALGQPDLAEKGFSAAFQGAPQQENYALDLGMYYLRRRQYAKALETMKAAVKFNPESLYVALGLGLAQVLGDDPPRAIATCRRILAKDPNFGSAHLVLVAAFYLNGENQNCATEAESALLQPGGPPYLYYLHAASLLKLNSEKYTIMLHDLDVANRAIPNCSVCYLAQSKVHQEMGQEGAAIADLEHLLRDIDPEFAQAWYRLANLYQHAGRHDDSANALARFRSLKADQTDRETEYLRRLFLSASGSEEGKK